MLKNLLNSGNLLETCCNCNFVSHKINTYALISDFRQLSVLTFSLILEWISPPSHSTKNSPAPPVICLALSFPFFWTRILMNTNSKTKMTFSQEHRPDLAKIADDTDLSVKLTEQSDSSSNGSTSSSSSSSSSCSTCLTGMLTLGSGGRRCKSGLEYFHC